MPWLNYNLLIQISHVLLSPSPYLFKKNSDMSRPSTNCSKAKWHKVAAGIRQRIGQGSLLSGDKLPTWDEVGRELGISRITVQAAMRELKQDGFIRAVRNLGTFVSDTPPNLYRHALVLPKTPASANWTHFMATISDEAMAIEDRYPHSMPVYQGVDGHSDTPGYGTGTYLGVGYSWGATWSLREYWECLGPDSFKPLNGTLLDKLVLGQVFARGYPLRQVRTLTEVQANQGTWCALEGGKAIAVHFLPWTKGAVEISVRQQVFAPELRGLGYIRVDGFVIEHAANQGPFPQAGMLSTRSGHDWIIENNVIRFAATAGT